jgi:hypothetical protein
MKNGCLPHHSCSEVIGQNLLPLKLFAFGLSQRHSPCRGSPCCEKVIQAQYGHVEQTIFFLGLASSLTTIFIYLLSRGCHLETVTTDWTLVGLILLFPSTIINTLSLRMLSPTRLLRCPRILDCTYMNFLFII